MDVAATWYECQKLGNGIWRIREPHVHSFARCNIWFVEGTERNLLIDSGTGLLPLRSALPGVDERPVVAVATHIHFDHVGALHEFPDRRAHDSEMQAFVTMPDEATLAHLFRDLNEPVAQLPAAGWTPEQYGLRPAPLGAALADGDRIDLGNRSLSVMHVPGHSRDSIALFEERTGILFSGDALYDGELIDTFPSSDLERYRTTMFSLKELEISLGHGGHGPSFSNVRKNVLVDEYLAGRRAQGCPQAAQPLSRD